MSRSFKHNNFCGYAADSDKSWKRMGNRKFRRRRTGDSLGESGGYGEPDIRSASNTCLSNKDGKCLWRPEDASPEDRLRHFTRKGKMRK